jgi:hypothetical protein
VIIPAYDAAGTIAETLESLLAQTSPDWEAIVVDDGSGDETPAVVARFAERDPRIRLLHAAHGGVSRARNAGIAQARSDWLLFLDADDWLLPPMIERMTGALAADPALDAVHCGWTLVLEDRTTLWPDACRFEGDLFAAFSGRCAFPIHCCVVRRSLVQGVGAFAPSRSVAADWDLWQRVARTGARFGAVRERLACYRVRPGSMSSDAAAQLAEALGVVTLGHSPDPRVRDPAPAHAHGAPAGGLAGARLRYVCWCAGMMLGQMRDPRPLLAHCGADRDPTLDGDFVAAMLHRGAPFGAGRALNIWDEIWPGAEPIAAGFLEALEAQAAAPGLAGAARRTLERLVLEHSTARRGHAPRPATLGDAAAVWGRRLLGRLRLRFARRGP